MRRWVEGGLGPGFSDEQQNERRVGQRTEQDGPENAVARQAGVIEREVVVVPQPDKEGNQQQQQNEQEQPPAPAPSSQSLTSSSSLQLIERPPRPNQKPREPQDLDMAAPQRSWDYAFAYCEWEEGRETIPLGRVGAQGFLAAIQAARTEEGWAFNFLLSFQRPDELAGASMSLRLRLREGIRGFRVFPSFGLLRDTWGAARPQIQGQNQTQQQEIQQSQRPPQAQDTLPASAVLPALPAPVGDASDTGDASDQQPQEPS